MSRPFLFLILLLVPIAGCATTPPYEFRDPRTAVVWPAPPEKPRIRYLGRLHGPSDVVIRSSGSLARLARTITGDSPLGPDLITPTSVSTFEGRRLLVADPAARTVQWYDLSDREVLHLRSHGETPLRSPVAVAFAPDGSFYVTDSELRRVFHFSDDLRPSGELTGTTFGRPAGIAVTSDGEVAVADVLSNRIRLFDREGRYLRSIPADDSESDMNRPVAVAVDHQKRIYVTDSFNFRVLIFRWDGSLDGSFGEPGDTPGYLARPKGIALDSEGHLYLVDATMNVVQIFTPDGKLLLPFGGEGKKPGQFILPSGIHIDDRDRIFVADTYNRRVQVFQYLKDTKR